MRSIEQKQKIETGKSEKTNQIPRRAQQKVVSFVSFCAFKVSRLMLNQFECHHY